MPRILTAVYGWRCPFSFLYCFLRLKWKTRILSARPCSTTCPVTKALDDGLPSSPSEPLTASTSSNCTFSPPACDSFSTLITSPGATRYCLPPARITAYMLPPIELVAHTAARNRLKSFVRLHLPWPGRKSLRDRVTRLPPRNAPQSAHP